MVARRLTSRRIIQEFKIDSKAPMWCCGGLPEMKYPVLVTTSCCFCQTILQRTAAEKPLKIHLLHSE